MTTLADERLQMIKPIGLGDLVAQAALLTRVDRKYVVPVPAAEALLEQLPTGTQMLDIEGRRDFGYRSTYLVTPGRESFLTAGRSSRGRWKVRTRAYLDTGTTWLEVKTRGPRNATVKRRIPHPEADASCGLTASGRAFVADCLGHRVAAALPGDGEVGGVHVADKRRGLARRVEGDGELTFVGVRHGRGDWYGVRTISRGGTS